MSDQKNKRLLTISFSIIALLLLPLIAMQFTDEVNWSGSDFLVAAVLLISTGTVAEVIMRKVAKPDHRTLAVVVLLLFLVLVWVELAVGIFGSPLAGN